jgi:hypothetical protein
METGMEIEIEAEIEKHVPTIILNPFLNAVTFFVPFNTGM